MAESESRTAKKKKTPGSRANKLGVGKAGRAATKPKPADKTNNAVAGIAATRPQKRADPKGRSISSPVQYVAKLDSKKRITVRSARSEYYTVTELAGGVLLLKPHEEFRLEDLPADALAMIDQAADHFKAGRVSEPIKLD